MMERYVSRSGKPSGATAYRLGADYIIVRFKDQDYRYSYRSCGREHVNNMKACALQQEGLSTYIAQHRPQYEE